MREEPVPVPRAKQLSGAARVKVVAPPDMFDRIHKLHNEIACRAFQLWEEAGCMPGPNLEYWLRAESEMLHPTHVELNDEGSHIAVRAETPGFSHKDLNISVRGRRLMIIGQRVAATENTSDTKLNSTDHCSDQLLRVIDLPANVKAEQVTAWLKDGILEITIPKAKPARRFPQQFPANEGERYEM